MGGKRVYNKIYADQHNYHSFSLQNSSKRMQMENIARTFFVKNQDFAILIGSVLQVELRRS